MGSLCLPSSGPLRGRTRRPALCRTTTRLHRLQAALLGRCRPQSHAKARLRGPPPSAPAAVAAHPLQRHRTALGRHRPCYGRATSLEGRLHLVFRRAPVSGRRPGPGATATPRTVKSSASGPSSCTMTLASKRSSALPAWPWLCSASSRSSSGGHWGTKRSYKASCRRDAPPARLGGTSWPPSKGSVLPIPPTASASTV
jgi:hypothetical protein